jgi:hypothetical protein
MTMSLINIEERRELTKTLQERFDQFLTILKLSGFRVENNKIVDPVDIEQHQPGDGCLDGKKVIYTMATDLVKMANDLGYHVRIDRRILLTDESPTVLDIYGVDVWGKRRADGTYDEE